jgi:homoserine kinase type II
VLNNRYDPNAVLGQYPADCRPVEPPEPIAGGLSGSGIWRLKSLRGPLCLRQWPVEHPGLAQLCWIHSVLASVDKAGFKLLPLPIPGTAGKTFVEHAGHLWELTPWMAGSWDNPGQLTKATSQSRIQAALTALAEFHKAVEATLENRQTADCPPGVLKRLERLEALQNGGMDLLVLQIAKFRDRWPELANRSYRFINLIHQASACVRTSLQRASQFRVHIDPCIRDIHREHVLFDGERISGLIDFGAMQPDNFATDIARLLGSMAIDDFDLWQAGLAAYGSISPLNDSDRLLVSIYDQSMVLLSGINWLEWIFVENRQFSDRSAVLSRFDAIAGRLLTLANRIGQSAV